MAELKANAAATLAELCRQAVARHGEDWSETEFHVDCGIDRMRPDDRVAFLRDLHEILAFEPPAPGFGPSSATLP